MANDSHHIKASDFSQLAASEYFDLTKDDMYTHAGGVLQAHRKDITEGYIFTYDPNRQLLLCNSGLLEPAPMTYNSSEAHYVCTSIDEAARIATLYLLNEPDLRYEQEVFNERY